MRILKAVTPQLFAVVVFVSGAFISPAARAQDTATPPTAAAPAPKTYDRQEIQKRAEALIDAGDAKGIWEARDNANAIDLRHSASGLTCFFSPDSPGRVIVFQKQPRGSDVGCTFEQDGAVVSFFATRQPEDMTLDEFYRSTVLVLQTVYRGAQPYQMHLSMSASTTDGQIKLSDDKTAAFLITTPNGLALSRASVTLHDGWGVTMRYTTSKIGSDDDKLVAELGSSMLWMTVLAGLGPEKPKAP